MMNGFALVLATVLLMVLHTWRYRRWGGGKFSTGRNSAPTVIGCPVACKRPPRN